MQEIKHQNKNAAMDIRLVLSIKLL